MLNFYFSKRSNLFLHAKLRLFSKEGQTISQFLLIGIPKPKKINKSVTRKKWRQFTIESKPLNTKKNKKKSH